MKKNLTRVLALAMALLMCLSLLPVSALAGDADFAAMIASAQAAQAAAMGGTAPDMTFVMPEQALDYTDPNVCLASEDGQHLWIEVHDPAYICAWGDCTEENPHILYKSCAYCKQSAEPLYANELEAIQIEAQVFAETQEEIPPEQYDDWDYRAYHKYIFELPDHFYEKQDGQAPTCTAGGHTAYEQCSVCEDIRGYEELDPLGHNWGDYTVTVEPTCTAAGTKMRECLRCGEKEYVDIPALGHDWGEFVTVKEPTCTETGTTKRVCERCGAEDFGEIPAKGHSYGDFTILKEATCTEDGSKEHTCAVCQYKETVVIPAAHTWGDFTVTKEATCTEAGEQEHTCTVCDVTETVAIPAKDHSYGEDGVCTVCGAEKPAEPAVVEPTVEEPKDEEPKDEEPKEELKEEPAGAQPVGAIVEDCRDMYSSFGAFLAEQNAADAKYVVASYTPVDANGHALGEIPAGGVRFDLPLPEGADAASVQVYTYDYSTYSWSPANFFLSDGQATVSSGAYPFPPFAVLAAPAAAGNSGETTPTEQETSPEETVNEFKNILNEKGVSDGTGEIVVQHVTPLREDGTEMSNEEVAERGGIYFEMDLPEGYEEGDTLNIGHRNSETGEWEIITDYEIKGNKVIIHATHFSDYGMELKKGGGNAPLLGATGGGNFSDPVIQIGGSPVSEAKVGDELTAVVTPGTAGMEFEYIWVREENGTYKTISGATGATYTLTASDCPYAVYCSVNEKNYEKPAKLSTGVHVRMEVPFSTAVTGSGSVSITNTDTINTSQAVKYISYPSTETPASPFNIDALTQNRVTITVNPNSDTGYMVRYVMEDSKVLIPATREQTTYTMSNVTKDQATHNITVFFDIPECKVYTTPTLDPDLLAAANPDIEATFKSNYVKDGCKYAYYYVTPKWTTAPAVPLTAAEITAAGGFSPEMGLPTGVTSENYDNFSVKVYHYNSSAELWEEAEFEKVPGRDAVKLKNQTAFSPFGIVATPSVKLTLNPGSGSGSMDAVTTLVGGTVTVPQSTFTAPANKTFDYWEGTSNEAHPEGKYQAGEVLTLADDLTLTAQWAGGFTVTFDKNDNYPGLTGTAEGDMPQQFVKESDEEAGTAKLNANQFTLKNHTFKGWSKTPGNKAPDYATDFKDQDKLNKTTYPDQTDLTLYAVWQRTHVSVSYNANGGSGTMAEQHAPVDSSLPLSANKFTAPASNMMFAGWSKDSPTGNIAFKDGETVDVADDLNNTDVTLYAVWREKVTIHFRPDSDSGTGTGTMTDQTVPANTPTALKKNTFIAPSTAMAFAGWNDRQDGNGNDYVDGGEYSFNGDVYLYAQWGPAITITYNKNSSDASGTMADQRVAANESFKLNELGFTNPSATFKGWAETSTGTPKYDIPGNPDTKKVPGFPENKTLYAIWDKHAFTGTVRITGSSTGSADKAIVGEELTANVTGESKFTEFKYQWLKNGVEIPGATEQTYEPTTADAGQMLTCQVLADDSPDKNKKTSINSKTVGIEDSEEKIICVYGGGDSKDYILEPASVDGLYKGMYYTLDNKPGGTIDVEGKAELTQQGVYRFYTGSDMKTLLGTVEVTKWYAVGYSNSTSSGTTSSGTTGGSGTITAKATYDGTERSLTTSTTIKDSSTGEVVLEPYTSVPAFGHIYDHVWIIRNDYGVGFSLTVRPSSGSYGHVSTNGGSYDSGSQERTYKYYALYDIIFNRSSSSPRTADDSHLGLWSALCFMSLAGATVLLNGQRKRRKARR